VTYPKNEHLRQAARAAPLDRLLVETDSPFLAPQKLRGSDNEPANVTITLRELAAERGETFEALRDATTTNAFAVFGGLQ
jgi:TatD DNase family protein